MIARIVFPHAGARYVATLGDDRRWSCPLPQIREILNTLVALVDRSSVAGEPYTAHAHQMARILKGEIDIPPRRPMPPGTVY